MDKLNMELVDTRPPIITTKEWDLLNVIASRSLASVNELSVQFFSATDGLFYELSDRASTNNEENLYFEAMRAIRISKASIISSFEHKLRENFDNIAALSVISEPQKNDDDELSIIGSEELEIDLAQKNMADRTRDTYKQELYDLESRLDALLSDCKISQHCNPLDPNLIAKAFVESCIEHLKLDIKTRLILFKLFEKHFLKQLGHLYAEANQCLIEAGILPKVPHRRANDDDDEPSSAIEAQEKVIDTVFETFDDEQKGPQPFQLETNALASLMASIRNARRTNNPAVQDLGNYHYYSSNPGTVMPVPELANLLTSNQPEVEQQLASTSPQNLVPRIVTDILSFKNPEEPQALDQPDEDIINLVALFFDKVLEDEHLPMAVQSLICRLQIPVLKVALNDKTFLTNEKHPARELINAITKAGLSFDESKPLERDPLYKALTEGVHTINYQFKLDDQVFTDATRSIHAAVNAEAKKSSVVESRTKQTETGKAKLKAARAFSQSTLYEKLKDTSLPKGIGEFLTNTWLQVMVITYVRGGKESAEWVENEQLISDLIWVSQSYDDEKSQARQQRLIPEILHRIEFGLELVIDSPDIRKTKATDVAKALELVRSGSSDKTVYEALSNEQINKLGKADPEKKKWDEMTALERQQARYEELSSKFYLEAKNMPENTWLIYMHENKRKEIRCKLSTKIDAENYIFVNRLGFKSLTRSRRQLAYDMQFKKARVLDTGPIFERLMDRVVTQIRSISKEM